MFKNNLSIIIILLLALLLIVLIVHIYNKRIESLGGANSFHFNNQRLTTPIYDTSFFTQTKSFNNDYTKTKNRF